MVVQTGFLKSAKFPSNCHHQPINTQLSQVGCPFCSQTNVSQQQRPKCCWCWCRNVHRYDAVSVQWPVWTVVPGGRSWDAAAARRLCLHSLTTRSCVAAAAAGSTEPNHSHKTQENSLHIYEHFCSELSETTEHKPGMSLPIDRLLLAAFMHFAIVWCISYYQRFSVLVLFPFQIFLLLLCGGVNEVPISVSVHINILTI